MCMGKLSVFCFVLFIKYNSLEDPVTMMYAQSALIQLHVMQEQQ